LRKLTATISKANASVIFINQIRMKIGVMLRQSGDHHRRKRPQVLRLAAPGHPPRRRIQGRRDG